MAGKMKALQYWCQKNTSGYRDVNVVNMTTSWKDGLAFCALIHHFRPDLIDFDSLSKENVLYNNQLAFQTAEKELGIAALLDAEDMVAMKVPDKLSILTYVSQYYNILHKLEPVSKLTSKDIKPIKRNATASIEREVKKKPPEEIQPPKPVVQKQSTFSICDICKKRVHLVERYIDDGKIYHRQCHRTKSLHGMYQREDSQSTTHHNSNNVIETETNRMKIITGKVSINSSKIERDESDVISKNSLRFKNVGNKISEPVNSSINRNSGGNTGSIQTYTAPKLDSCPTSAPVDAAIDDSVSKNLSPLSVSLTAKPSLNHPKPYINSNRSNINQPDSSKTKVEVSTNNNLKSLSNKRKLNSISNLNTSEIKVEEPSVMLPSLLQSLDSSKQSKDQKGVTEYHLPSAETSSDDFAPLISELPCAPLTKPRLSSTDLDPSSEIKPLPRKRTNGSTKETIHVNRKFNLKSEINSYDDSLNPFGEETDNDHVSELAEVSAVHLSNPFEDDDDNQDLKESHDEKAKIKPLNKLRIGTVNITTPNDKRLNPFTEEYEGKKQPGTPPKPPNRRKGAATNRTPTPSETTDPTPAESSPQNWKSDVEKKMEQLNQSNSADKRFVNTTTTSKTTAFKHDRSQILKDSTQLNKLKSPKKIKSNRPAPGFGFPLVKRKVKSQMTEDEIASEMAILDMQLKDLEKKGVKLEEVLREDMELESEPKADAEQRLGEWFDLVQEKNKLVRRETELVYLMQQQRLEQEYADVEFKIRKLMNKPENEKTPQDIKDESKLLDKLVLIVERRNTIINSIEEERLKEEEEDAAYDKLKSMQVDSNAESDSGKKKKPKLKKMFGLKKKSSKSPKPEISQSPS